MLLPRPPGVASLPRRRIAPIAPAAEFALPDRATAGTRFLGVDALNHVVVLRDTSPGSSGRSKVGVALTASRESPRILDPPGGGSATGSLVEDIIQDAFAKVVSQPNEAPDDEVCHALVLPNASQSGG